MIDGKHTPAEWLHPLDPRSYTPPAASPIKDFVEAGMDLALECTCHYDTGNLAKYRDARTRLRAHLQSAATEGPPA